MAQAAMLLAEYPANVIAYVTDPRTGIQRTAKFPPTISELADACEMKLTAIHRQKELNDWHERKRKSDQTKALARPEVTSYPGTLSYGEHLERCEKLKINTRVRGRFEL